MSRSIRKYRKKPIVIEAARLFNDSLPDITGWLSDGKASVDFDWSDGDLSLTIKTLEGDMRADRGDWIVRGTAGEFYPVKHEIFKDIYEVEEE